MGGCSHGSKNKDDLSNVKQKDKKKRVLHTGSEKLLAASSDVSYQTRESDQNGSMFEGSHPYGVTRDPGHTDVSMDGTFMYSSQQNRS